MVASYKTVPPRALLHTCFPPFSISRHCPLSTTPGTGYIVHSGPESFFQCRCKADLQIAIDILKAHNHAATIPALALVKRHLFYHFPFCCVLGDLFFYDGVSSSI